MVERQISLPESTSEYIDKQVASGRYQSPSEFVADLIEQARIGIPSDRLQQLVREGLEFEGEDIEFTDEWWECRMDELKAEAERRRSA